MRHLLTEAHYDRLLKQVYHVLDVSATFNCGHQKAAPRAAPMSQFLRFCLPPYMWYNLCTGWREESLAAGAWPEAITPALGRASTQNQYGSGARSTQETGICFRLAYH